MHPLPTYLQQAAMARHSQATGSVYFIGPAGPRRLLKIGFSCDVNRRLREIQSVHPEPLFVFEEVRGTRSTESAFHRQFAEYRAQGEWFEKCAAIRDDIYARQKAFYSRLILDEPENLRERIFLDDQVHLYESK